MIGVVELANGKMYFNYQIMETEGCFGTVRPITLKLAQTVS